MRNEEEENVASAWNKFIEEAARDNKISKCQTGALVVQGLLFLDEIPTGRQWFGQVEVHILKACLEELASTCGEAR